MGEGISPETREKIARLAEKYSAVVKTKNILSTYQSPEEVILMLIIDFKEHLSSWGRKLSGNGNLTKWFDGVKS